MPPCTRRAPLPRAFPISPWGGLRGLGVSVVIGGGVVGGLLLLLLLRGVVEQLLDTLLLQDGWQLVVVEEVDHGVLQAKPP